MTLPVVSLSTNVTTLVESEGSVLTFNFEVEGDIPEGGLPVKMDIDEYNVICVKEYKN